MADALIPLVNRCLLICRFDIFLVARTTKLSRTTLIGKNLFLFVLCFWIVTSRGPTYVNKKCDKKTELSLTSKVRPRRYEIYIALAEQVLFHLAYTSLVTLQDRRAFATVIGSNDYCRRFKMVLLRIRGYKSNITLISVTWSTVVFSRKIRNWF